MRNCLCKTTQKKACVAASINEHWRRYNMYQNKCWWIKNIEEDMFEDTTKSWWIQKLKSLQKCAQCEVRRRISQQNCRNLATKGISSACGWSCSGYRFRFSSHRGSVQLRSPVDRGSVFKNIWRILDEYNIFAEVRTVRSAQKYFAAHLQKCAPGFRNCWGVPSTGVPYSWLVPAKTKPDEMPENRIPFLSKSHVISLPGKCRVNYHSSTSTIDGLENLSSLLPIRKRFFVESRNKCFS